MEDLTLCREWMGRGSQERYRILGRGEGGGTVVGMQNEYKILKKRDHVLMQTNKNES